ncbi:hypothetical protein [Streptomyces sp. cg35]|uniref:hypothetical protein n=1 Tax=Streptomyces sp. cg35 TaxID=3421650 RepID=UPI003D17CF28
MTAAEHIAEGQRILAQLDELASPAQALYVQQAQAHFAAAQALNTLPAPVQEAPAAYTMSDADLWDSPVGHRVRHYADKLLLAEAERIRMSGKRNADGVVAEGVEFGRAIVSPLGDPNAMLDGDDTRAASDPWANWQSTEAVGLRGAVAASDKTREGAQGAAKAYLARLEEGSDAQTG